MRKTSVELFFFIGSIAGVLISIFSVVSTLKNYLSQAIGISHIDFYLLLFTEGLNIVVLLIFFMSIKRTSLNFDTDQQYELLCENLKLTIPPDVSSIALASNAKGKVELATPIDSQQIRDAKIRLAKFNNNRVNKLISQLTIVIQGYIIFLCLFYVVNFVVDANPGRMFDHSSNILKKWLDFFENICNLISAAFLYLGFKVMFDSTLDEYNQPKDYYKGTLVFLLAYVILYLVLIFATQGQVATQFRLVCGIYNGLSMALLFGRFTALEYFFKDVYLNKPKWSRDFYLMGALFILSLYILAQPLYGILGLAIFPNSEVFKSLVFIVCFIGKSFFLLLFLKYTNYRWLHVYLHFVLANHTIPKNIAEVFPQIAGSPEKLGNDSGQIVSELIFYINKEDLGECLTRLEWLKKHYIDTNSPEPLIINNLIFYWESKNYEKMLSLASELKGRIT